MTGKQKTSLVKSTCVFTNADRTLFISRSSSNNCSFRAGAFSYLLPHWLLCAGEKSCHLNKLICCHCYVGFKYLLYLVSTLTLTVSTHNSGMFFVVFFSCEILKQTKIIIINNNNLLSLLHLTWLIAYCISMHICLPLLHRRCLFTCLLNFFKSVRWYNWSLWR